MAENVTWLLDQAGPDARIALWAHNGHVGMSADESFQTLEILKFPCTLDKLEHLVYNRGNQSWQGLFPACHDFVYRLRRPQAAVSWFGGMSRR
jgi:hypothetical protein